MAVDTFIKIGSIKGESTDDKHKEEIEVLSWSWGVASSLIHSGTGGSATIGRASFRELTFTHHIDRASPALMKACAVGESLREATLTARKAGRVQRDYLIIKMSDVIVTGVAPSDGTPAGPTIESVTLSFGRVE